MEIVNNFYTYTIYVHTFDDKKYILKIEVFKIFMDQVA